MKYKIAVSGAAKLNHCCEYVKKLAREVGREIARQKCVLVTGATSGAPYYAAQGFKEIGGFSVGFSPASSEAAHLKTYRLPVDVFDVIVYTGFDYSGRNLLMTNAADGVIIICGRMGTLNEFTTAYEDKKPIAILEGSGGVADKIKIVATGPQRNVKRLIFERDPKKLVEELIKLIKAEKENNSKYSSKKIKK